VGIASETASEVEIVGVGGAENNGEVYPFVVRFSVGSDNSLEVLSTKILFELPGSYFDEVRIDGSENVYTSGSTEVGESCHPFVWSLTDSLVVNWSVEMLHEGVGCSGVNELSLVANTLYAAGKLYVKRNDQLWSDGLLASLSLDGQVNWMKKLALSKYADTYNDCFADGNALYAVGSISGYEWINTRRLYGFALLTKLDALTGDVQYHRNFGSCIYGSSFYDFMMIGQQAYCVGFTHFGVSTHGYQGWFTHIDLSSVTTSNHIEPLERGDVSNTLVLPPENLVEELPLPVHDSSNCHRK
jgi:hypothetical protein